MYALAAGGYRFRSLRLTDPQMRGWDVYAFQTAFPGIVPDGVFGPKTHMALIALQQRVAKRQPGFPVDGIAGPLTLRAASLEGLPVLEVSYATPPGLAPGILEGESGLNPGEYTKPYANGTRDVGVAEENVVPTETNLQRAFHVRDSEERLCRMLRNRFDGAFGKSTYVDTPRECWRRAAVLYHNWQAASNRYVDGTIAKWRYEARFVPGGPADAGLYVHTRSDGSQTRSYAMGDRAQWIVLIGVQGVDTGYEWAHHYIESKVGYVTTWPR